MHWVTEPASLFLSGLLTSSYLLAAFPTRPLFTSLSTRQETCGRFAQWSRPLTPTSKPLGVQRCVVSCRNGLFFLGHCRTKGVSGEVVEWRRDASVGFLPWRQDHSTHTQSRGAALVCWNAETKMSVDQDGCTLLTIGRKCIRKDVWKWQNVLKYPLGLQLMVIVTVN